MSEMVERVARTIYEQRNGYGCVPWSRRDHAHKAPYLADARAAIEATGMAALVEQAFRDGLAFASNVLVHDPDEAWRTSRVRASLHEGEAER